MDGTTGTHVPAPHGLQAGRMGPHSKSITNLTPIRKLADVLASCTYRLYRCLLEVFVVFSHADDKPTSFSSKHGFSIHEFLRLRKKVFLRKGELPPLTQISVADFLEGTYFEDHDHEDMFEMFYVLSGGVNQSRPIWRARVCLSG